LFTSIPIVSFSGRGLSVSLTLFHNSASSSSLQPFGYGWTHSYNWKIQRDSQTGDAIVVRGTGGLSQRSRCGVDACWGEVL
jgi:hypothetical protein